MTFPAGRRSARFLAVASRRWQRIHEALCRRVRQQSGKKPTPSVAIVDSQSIRTAEGGEDRGYDAGKKITGRKRHLSVDTLGLVWAVVVHGAYWQDHDGAFFVFQKFQAFGRLRVIFADRAYGRNGLPDFVKHTFGWLLQIVLRPVQAKGFIVLPKRWIVERTFAWLSRCRRNCKGFQPPIERLGATGAGSVLGMDSPGETRLNRKKIVVRRLEDAGEVTLRAELADEQFIQ